MRLDFAEIADWPFVFVAAAVLIFFIFCAVVAYVFAQGSGDVPPSPVDRDGPRSPSPNAAHPGHPRHRSHG